MAQMVWMVGAVFCLCAAGSSVYGNSRLLSQPFRSRRSHELHYPVGKPGWFDFQQFQKVLTNPRVLRNGQQETQTKSPNRSDTTLDPKDTQRKPKSPDKKFLYSIDEPGWFDYKQFEKSTSKQRSANTGLHDLSKKSLEPIGGSDWFDIQQLKKSAKIPSRRSHTSHGDKRTLHSVGEPGWFDFRSFHKSKPKLGSTQTGHNKLSKKSWQSIREPALFDFKQLEKSSDHKSLQRSGGIDISKHLLNPVGDASWFDFQQFQKLAPKDKSVALGKQLSKKSFHDSIGEPGWFDFQHFQRAGTQGHTQKKSEIYHIGGPGWFDFQQLQKMARTRAN